MSCRLLSCFGLLVLSFTTCADAHGMVTSPRSRQWVAYEDGIEGSQANKPPREYCYQCANRKSGVCGNTPSYNYDEWLDSTGQPMPWQSQATYAENGIVTVKLTLTAHHWGHAEISACPLGRASTQSCFDANKLVFVQDNLYGMPADSAYPERGYFKFPGPDYEMQFRLPAGLKGDQVLLQWKYITANSCSPPGYASYFGSKYAESWNSVLGTCDLPYPQDGSVTVPGKSVPEQFFNCMEVSVGNGGTGGNTGGGTSGGTGGGGTGTGTGGGSSGGGGTGAGTGGGTSGGSGSSGGGSGTADGRCCPTGFSGLRAYNGCRFFYHCVNGQVTGAPVPCGQGLLFDDNGKYCDWERNVQCNANSDCEDFNGTGADRPTGGGTSGNDPDDTSDETGNDAGGDSQEDDDTCRGRLFCSSGLKN